MNYFDLVLFLVLCLTPSFSFAGMLCTESHGGPNWVDSCSAALNQGQTLNRYRFESTSTINLNLDLDGNGSFETAVPNLVLSGLDVIFLFNKGASGTIPSELYGLWQSGLGPTGIIVFKAGNGNGYDSSGGMLLYRLTALNSPGQIVQQPSNPLLANVAYSVFFELEIPNPFGADLDLHNVQALNMNCIGETGPHDSCAYTFDMNAPLNLFDAAGNVRGQFSVSPNSPAHLVVPTADAPINAALIATPEPGTIWTAMAGLGLFAGLVRVKASKNNNGRLLPRGDYNR